MSLEVDARQHDKLMHPQSEDENPKFSGTNILDPPFGPDKEYPPLTTRQQEQHIAGFRRTTVVLSVACAVFAVLAAVAAGVAGSIAVRRQHQSNR